MALLNQKSLLELAGIGSPNQEGVPLIIKHEEILSTLLSQITELDFRATAGLDEGENISNKHYVVMSIDHILDIAAKNKWSMSMNDHLVYIFNGAFWKELGKEELSNFLGKAAIKAGVKELEGKYHRFKTELLKQFISTAHLPRPNSKKQEVLINLQNSTYVITPDKQVAKKFDKNDFLTYQLPFAFDESAQSPLFIRYLDRVLPDKKQQFILAEFIGYCFIRHGVLKLEKALILFGKGANGKSVFHEIINSLLGPVNVTNFSLRALTDNLGYTRARIANKLLNYASEISTQMDNTYFKQLVSGEPIEARLPYVPPYTIEDYAKLIFNTNELPKDVEINEAYFRRFLIIHFAETIPDSERDPELASKIIKDELPGVFNWVLTGLQRLMEQKKFTYSEAVENNLKEYRQFSDSVQLFLTEKGYSFNPPTVEITLQSLHAAYVEYCTESGYKPVSNKTLAQRLRSIGYSTTLKTNGTVVDVSKK